MHRTQQLVCLSLVAAGLVACGKPTATVTVQPTLSDIQAKIFTPTCATSSCHSGDGVALSDNLDLSAGNSYANLVGVPAQYQGVTLDRVKAGDPMNSFLYIKVANPETLNTTMYGLAMPNGGTPLSSQAVQAISDWITAGAQNN
jgi:hypothetical protein